MGKNQDQQDKEDILLRRMQSFVFWTLLSAYLFCWIWILVK